MLVDCKCAFIVYTSLMSEDEVFEFIDEIGIDAGVTDEALYFGLSRRDTDDNFQLSEFIHESLGSIFKKADKLIELKKQYKCNYVLNIKFSDIEEEIENNQSFIIDDITKEFINKTDTYYNLNDGYFD